MVKHVMSEAEKRNLGAILADQKRPIKERIRALFALRNTACDLSVHLVAACLDDPSALLKHELAYCMGQMQNKTAIPYLIKTLENERQEPMVRHEAGEALGAIGDPSTLPVLRKYEHDENADVAETCQLARQRIEWCLANPDKRTDSPYDSVDPTPSTAVNDVATLRTILLDETKSLWERYGALFRLRNLNSTEAIQAICDSLRDETSALFRHEVAYVLGQIQSPISYEALKNRLAIQSENCMVRHECAEAIGSSGSVEPELALETLREYAKDDERVVAESCEVALDINDYHFGDDFEYAEEQ